MKRFLCLILVSALSGTLTAQSHFGDTRNSDNPGLIPGSTRSSYYDYDMTPEEKSAFRRTMFANTAERDRRMKEQRAEVERRWKEQQAEEERKQKELQAEEERKQKEPPTERRGNPSRDTGDSLSSDFGDTRNNYNPDLIREEQSALMKTMLEQQAKMEQQLEELRNNPSLPPPKSSKVSLFFLLGLLFAGYVLLCGIIFCVVFFVKKSLSYKNKESDGINEKYSPQRQ
jgi:hypothetical protein